MRCAKQSPEEDFSFGDGEEQERDSYWDLSDPSEEEE